MDYGARCAFDIKGSDPLLFFLLCQVFHFVISFCSLQISNVLYKAKLMCIRVHEGPAGRDHVLACNK